MRPIIYSLQFTGQATAIRDGVLRATTSAPSCHLVTTVGPDGVVGMLEPVDGETAASAPR
jgi:hypothetical protein